MVTVDERRQASHTPEAGSARDSVMIDVPSSGLLRFAKKLLATRTLPEVLLAARDEVRSAVGYAHVWFMVGERESPDELRLIDFVGDRRELAWDHAPVLQIAGDPFLEELIASEGPVVIVDARTDPRTNKELVAKLQNRTLINIPLRLLDKPFGIFGMGTFGDEGCRSPDPAALDYLVGMASQIALAAGRVRFEEARALADREKLELERRLLHAQKLESLGLLAGGVAHDFNNLLTIILSSALLAEQATEEPSTREDLRAIIDAGTRARGVTRQLLAMGRQQDLRLAPLDLNARLAEMAALLRRVMPESIELDVIPGANLPFVSADASALDQVIMNLCINARDAMPEGGRLTIESEQVLINGGYAATHPWAKPGRYVLVTVTDTGEGMSRQVIDHIFEPFFTTKAERSGTGLGLAISYGIVRQHGGMLSCYSEPGLGAAFKVYLPAGEQLASAVGTKLIGAPPRARIDERVLLVEDDDAVRAVASRILQQAGYQVRSAEHGAAACDVLRQQAFELVILDIVMPGIPCRELVERLRVIQPGCRILLASGYSAAANLTDLLRQTGLELLRKPYDPDHLLVSVRRALDATQIASTPA
jgi:signal transduction histidine kinase/ActR/RegA family two-component response regulator